MTTPEPLPPRLRAELQPVGKAPMLGRVNGFGWILMGSRDVHPPSDTYVATRVFCALFVPIFPTDAWRVRKIGDSTWTFLGKVPLSPFASRLQKAAMLAAAVIIVRGVWPAAPARTAPVPSAATSTDEQIFTPVPIVVPKDREDAPELAAWIAREQQAVARLRDSAAANEATIASESQRLAEVENQLAATAADPNTAARERLTYERTRLGGTLNQLFGNRRMLQRRTQQREQELADSIRAFEG